MSGVLAVDSKSNQRTLARRANRWAYGLACHWMAGFSIVFGLFIALPFLAPLLMSLGWEFPAKIIYTVYSFLCHQLPQRSYFLFGEQFTYSLAEINQAWPSGTDFQSLRHFIGTAEMGWKVAWSDRMVSMYTSIPIVGGLWFALRKWSRPLHWSGLLLFLLPMAVDGFTHMASDLAGIGQGFRDTNAWLQTITNSAFPAAFYAGDAWGSFNSILRIVTGVLFGIGVVWFGFPYLADYFLDYKIRIQTKFTRAGLSI